MVEPFVHLLKQLGVIFRHDFRVVEKALQAQHAVAGIYRRGFTVVAENGACVGISDSGRRVRSRVLCPQAKGENGIEVMGDKLEPRVDHPTV